jgi:acetyl esterase/lipase
MMFFHNKFLGTPRPKELDDDWRVSPIRASSFAGLAPALVTVAEMDPLRDEGEEYARRMNAAGSKAEVLRLKGAPHTVMSLDDILEGGKEYNRVVIRALKEAFGLEK